MLDEISLRGIRSKASDRCYVGVSQSARYLDAVVEGWVPLGDLVGGIGEAIKKLKQQSVLIIGKAAENELLAGIIAMDVFELADIAEQIGWDGKAFSLPDGKLFSDGPSDRVITTFPRNAAKCATKGTLKGWKTGVAAKLKGQNLAIFAISLTFAAPILRLSSRVGNFGFELVGPKGIGKSTLEYIASSVLGGPVPGEDGHYWIGLDTTINALEDTMGRHNDLPIIFDEAGLLAAGAPPKDKAEIYKALVFKIGSGEQKDRLGANKRAATRHTFLVSANDSLADLTKQASESARAAGDRLMTIRIPEREHRVFDHLPAGFSDGPEYARELVGAAKEHHGHPIRSYLGSLVDERGRDENELRSWIAERVARFVGWTGIDGNDGSAYRVAEAFGLVYAAGKLAQRFKVLPSSMVVKAAVLATYRLHIGDTVSSRPFIERLMELATSEATVVVDKPSGDHSKSKLATIRNALAVLHKKSGGNRLIIQLERITEAFPDWERLNHSAEVRAMLWLEPGREFSQRKNCLAAGLERQRMFTFILPEIAAGDSLFD